MGRHRMAVELKGEDRWVTLTKPQAALLAQLRKPESVSMTIEEICKRAGVSPPTYYRHMKNEDFAKAIRQEFRAVMNGSLLSVGQHVVDMAKTESKSHHWAKMVMEMGDVYTPGGKAHQSPTHINLQVNLGIERPVFNENSQGIRATVTTEPTEPSVKELDAEFTQDAEPRSPDFVLESVNGTDVQ